MKKIIYRSLLVLISSLSLLGTIGLFDHQLNLRVLMMFTTLSNLIVLIYYVIDLYYLIFKKKDYCLPFKYMSMMGITLTFLTVVLVLHMGFDFSSMASLSLLGLHFIVPIMTILDWLIFDTKGNIKKRDPLIWTILPLSYVALIMLNQIVKGISFMDSYTPYSFLDISNPQVFLYLLLMAIAYLGVGYLYYFIDHHLSHKKTG